MKMEPVTQKLHEDIGKLTKMVEDIYKLIAGHELNREIGMIHQVKENKEKLETLEKEFTKVYYIATGISMAIGFITSFIIQIFF